MTPPTVIPPRVDRIPIELCGEPQWVAWRFEHRPGAATPWAKVPRQPLSGHRTSVTARRGWGSVAAAAAAVAEGRADGIGYVFTADPADPFVGIDLDGCRSPETGEIEPWAAAVVARLASYTEPSPSGTGLHVIVKVADKLAAVAMVANANRTGAIEVYATGRYFAFTGRPLPGHETIHDRTEELASWHRETFGAAPIPPPAPRTVDGDQLADDDVLIARAHASRNGAKFARLWSGDATGYPSASEADAALLGLLSFHTQDPDRLDRLYRASSLYRKKWERADYRERTLAIALRGRESIPAPIPPPAPNPTPPPAPVSADPCAEVRDELAELRREVARLTRENAELVAANAALHDRAEAAERRAALLSEVQSRTAAMLGNRRLGQERISAVALAHEFANRESSGDAGDGGLFRVPLARVAERAGISEDAASRHVAKLAEHGVLRKHVRTIPESIDHETGELTPLHRELWLAPVGGARGFAAAVATLDPARPTGWGGARPACPDHPTAPVRRLTRWECTDCGRGLRETVETLPPPEPQDAALAPQPAAATPNRPNARTEYVSHGGDQTRNMPVWPDAPPDAPQLWLFDPPDPPPFDPWIA